MLLKDAIEEFNDLRRVVERLELHSAAARRALLEAPYLRGEEEISREFDLVHRATPLEERQEIFPLLARVKDIRGTIHRLASGEIPDDIELFEIKTFALLADEIATLARAADAEAVEIPTLTPVIEILDPEANRLPHFYIYDSYSPALARLRAALANIGDPPPTPADETLAASLRVAALDEEERVREHLADRLRPHHRALAEALAAVARTDILLAKARLAREMEACRPAISPDDTRYQSLFHPIVRRALRDAGREFQPVDITFGAGVLLVTGANMGGKSVLLKSVALAQLLFQFGFHVPSARAAIVPVDEIFLSTGDGQDATRGLSTFAAEMLAINRVVGRIKSGKTPLVLLDEPAAGTNPAEGIAIVDAIVEFLARRRVPALVTTHHGGILAPCRKCRVRGLARTIDAALPVDRLHELMDYTLVEETDNDAPADATRVAELLGVDEEIIQSIKTYAHKRDTHE
ncbi:MAG: DNA mismatch repair protein MutS [Odoribacteraceae bacterium]|jgi:DNA mismatch repair ATPase MutS|nr:DNA mismatch repair protein MutS [Odoribacteraceae bacterium]